MESKTIEITKERLINVLSLYIGTTVLCRIYKIMQAGTLVGINTITNCAIVQTQHKTELHVPIGDVQLILKPLSAISDEDAIEVAKTMYTFDWSAITPKINRYDHRICIENIIGMTLNIRTTAFDINGYNLQGEEYCFATVKILKAIDYLRSRGYALPYFGIDLFQSKIAIEG